MAGGMDTANDGQMSGGWGKDAESGLHLPAQICPRIGEPKPNPAAITLHLPYWRKEQPRASGRVSWIS
ncbi:hypothetical protein VTN77DRAFT_399 [Rasamsonia byssochlamydoides]|uniref:uncharacterized protein n=1 Tax=Rasamsonia byssochlamydoides TaxID=89139 RepID=UPI0037436B44